MKQSHLERIAEMVLTNCGIKHEREYLFHPFRKWRFDFAIPEIKIAIEIEGGVWTNGRHTRGSGFIADCEKYNTAALMGWRVLRYHGGSIGDIKRDVEFLKLKGE